MIFTFGKYTVDIDVEKTREIYRTLPTTGQACGCDGCENFERAVDVLPAEVRSFFEALGVDPKRVTECYVNCRMADDTLYYGGFCHLCGTLVHGESAFVKDSPTSSYYDPDRAYHICKDFCVSFQEECHLLEKVFEAPVLQLDFEAMIPWVLDKENTYPKCT